MPPINQNGNGNGKLSVHHPASRDRSAVYAV